VGRLDGGAKDNEIEGGEMDDGEKLSFGTQPVWSGVQACFRLFESSNAICGRSSMI